MPIGFEGSGGVMGGYAALADIIATRKKDELLRQKQIEQAREFDLQQRQLEEQAAYRQAAQEETQLYHRATLEQRAAEAKAVEENRKLQERNRQVDNLVKGLMGTAPTDVTGQEYTQEEYELAKEGGLGGQFTPRPQAPVIDPLTGQPVQGMAPTGPQRYGFRGGTDYLRQKEAAVQAAADRKALQEDQQQHGMTMAQIAASLRAGQGPTDQNLFARTETLAKDWERVTKPAQKIDQSMGQIKVGVEALDRGDRPSASRTLVFGFNKLLDSISVVREGEVIATERAAALTDQIWGMKQKLVEGGSNLPDSELRQLARISQEIGAELKAALDLPTARKRVGARAKRFGVLEEDIFGEDKYGLEAPAVPPPAAAPGASKYKIEQLP